MIIVYLPTYVKNEISTLFTSADDELSYKRRMFNIMSFAVLDRRGLRHRTMERRIFLHTSEKGEKVYIQYPGKESERSEHECRPWDFRPKVIGSDGRLYPDLGFSMVWSDIRDISTKAPECLPVLATLLFRMANMIDHRFTDFRYPSQFIVKENKIDFDGEPVRIPYYRYHPPMNTIRFLQQCIGDIGGISIETYLLINDFIAQNEDCKYYYRGEMTARPEKNFRKWGDGIEE